MKKFCTALVGFQPRDNVGCRSGSSIISRIWPIAFLQCNDSTPLQMGSHSQLIKPHSNYIESSLYMPSQTRTKEYNPQDPKMQVLPFPENRGRKNQKQNYGNQTEFKHPSGSIPTKTAPPRPCYFSKGIVHTLIGENSIITEVESTTNAARASVVV